jgi:AcrR family transcriptional regulator
MPPPTPSRQTRERDLVAAARKLFDERGMQDAPIEEIAKAVGIARGLIYRHFSSKEELFFLTVTDYLDELCELLQMAIAAEDEPTRQLERLTEAYAGFCRRYPAFLDASLALMRRPARELNKMVSESIWLRLGQGMATCLDQVTQVLRRGIESGAFEVDDPDYTATVLWTSTLGTMHLTRLGIGVRQLGPGVPGVFRVTPERVVETCVANALATVRATSSA